MLNKKGVRERSPRKKLLKICFKESKFYDKFARNFVFFDFALLLSGDDIGLFLAP